jgi:hypothetical protein
MVFGEPKTNPDRFLQFSQKLIGFHRYFSFAHPLCDAGRIEMNSVGHGKKDYVDHINPMDGCLVQYGLFRKH